MTPTGYHDLPRSQRQEIVDHVRGAIATFNGPTLDGDDLSDLVRWTIDGLFRTSAFEDAYDEAYEAGVTHAVAVGSYAIEAAAIG